MRISDWSSDVFSSDLELASNPMNTYVSLTKVKTLCFLIVHLCTGNHASNLPTQLDVSHRTHFDIVQSLVSSGIVEVLTTCIGQVDLDHELAPAIGRAECRERVGQYV